MQWNLSIVDTTGPKFVVIREVSFASEVDVYTRVYYCYVLYNSSSICAVLLALVTCVRTQLCTYVHIIFSGRPDWDDGFYIVQCA